MLIIIKVLLILARRKLHLYSIFYPFYAFGEGVVELFFLISGFVMVLSYQEKILSKYSFKKYILKRILHFYPAFFISMFVVSFLQLAYLKFSNSTFIYEPFDALHVFLALVLQLPGLFFVHVPINGPAWCLSIEFYLYIILYLIIVGTNKAFSSSRKMLPFFYLILSLLSILLFLPYSSTTPFINHHTSRGFICFFFGCFLCCCYKYYLTQSVSKKTNTILNICIITAILGLLLILISFGLLSKEHRIISRLIEMLLIFPLIIWLSVNCQPIYKLLSIKPLIFLGNISLDIYIWHFPVELLFKVSEHKFNLNLDYSSVTVWLCYCFTVLLAAYASNLLFSSLKSTASKIISSSRFANTSKS